MNGRQEGRASGPAGGVLVRGLLPTHSPECVMQSEPGFHPKKLVSCGFPLILYIEKSQTVVDSVVF